MALEDIAGYSLRRKLGSGSAGSVWLVRDRASGRNAVLKRVPITAISHPEELREHLKILQRIDHPHLARLHHFRETADEWLLISQYVAAGTLSALLSRRGPLTPGELVTLLTPLAEALAYLHRTGLTHGRITPTNILFDTEGRPVLTDPALHPHLTAPTPTNTARSGVAPTESARTDTARTAHAATTSPTSPDPTDTAHPRITDPAHTGATSKARPKATASFRSPGPTDSARPGTALTDDLKSLADVAHQSGADPALFTPDHLTNPRTLLTIATPTPINLAFTEDPTPAATPKKPSTPDDPIDHSRTPLSPRPRPPEPTASPTISPKPPQPPTPKPSPRPTKPTRRNSSRPNRARPSPPNPLDRLTTPTAPVNHTPDKRPTVPADDKRPTLSADDRRLTLPTAAERAAFPADDERPALPTSDERAALPADDERVTPSPVWNDSAHRSPITLTHQTRRRSRPRPWRRSHTPRRKHTRPHNRTPPATPSARLQTSNSTDPTRPPAPRQARPALRHPVLRHPVLHRLFPRRLVQRRLALRYPVPVLRRPVLRHPAYGVLAAAALGAVVVLILGLLTVSALGNDPAGTAAATHQSPAPTDPAPSNPAVTNPASPTSPPSADPTKWTQTLQALDTQRAKAFWTLDPTLLDTIYVPGSAPWKADQALLTTYRKHQIRIRNLTIHISKTTIESQTPTEVVLHITDHLTTAQALTPTGTTTNLPPATPTPRRITLTTTPTTPTWRITAITPA
ncbi:protein kinase [Kribbella sp. NPDC050470]|uniref:protein kinase domain-containing protein n=1 Tax=unclassified Kribbella TaxID=2644121 RepID=UPI003788A318